MQLEKESTQQYVIEKSKFITYVNRCFDEQEARSYILSIKKLHPKANHCCSAFIIGENNELTRSSDDGEPSSTAGMPILASLKGSGIKNIVAVVVRYFGGIKLGTGGLIRAYSGCVSDTLAKADKLDTILMYFYQINIPYSLQGKITYALKNEIILNTEYDIDVIIDFMSESCDIHQILKELTSGKYLPNLIKSKIIERKL